MACSHGMVLGPGQDCNLYDYRWVVICSLEGLRRVCFGVLVGQFTSG